MKTLFLGDCLDVLKTLVDNSVDSVVTDPPYGLSFMGKHWDYDVPGSDVWAECLRVLKPGGHLLAFAGTRTQHRMAVRIEDAGFEIRDMIAWVYGSGFPKSLDVSKAIAKRAGGALVALDAIAFMRARREEMGLSRKQFEHCIFGRSDGNIRNWEDGISIPKPGLWPDIKRAMGLNETPFDDAMERGDEEIGREGGNFGYQKDGTRWDNERVIRSPSTDAAKQWQGFGTALKPALEPITVARKPLVGTVAANVLAHGCGALNIDGCRVVIDPVADASQLRTMNRSQKDDANGWGMNKNGGDTPTVVSPQGRWPANLIHDGSDEVVALFPDAPGQQGKSNDSQRTKANCYGDLSDNGKEYTPRGDTGSAARFFYQAKTSKKDRGEGNWHPTVKPTDLMRYLCRLVTPPGGVVLDPFMGSGSTGKAAVLEGFRFIGIERDEQYFDIASTRIDGANPAQASLL